ILSLCSGLSFHSFYFFFQAEDGIRDFHVTGVQTCALPICREEGAYEHEENGERYAYERAPHNRRKDQALVVARSHPEDYGVVVRSEERRVGKECWARRSLNEQTIINR